MSEGSEFLTAGNLVAISFILFWVIIFTKGRSAVSGALNSRVDEIRERIEAGEKIRDEAMSALSQCEQDLRNAEEDAKTMLEDVKKSAKEAGVTARARSKDAIDAQQKGLTARVAALEVRATDDVRNIIIDTAISASTDVLKKKYAKDTDVKKTIKEIKFS